MDDKGNDMKNKKIKIGVIYFILVTGVLLLSNYLLTQLTTEQVKYSIFREQVVEGKVKAVQIAKDRVIFTLNEDESKEEFLSKVYYTYPTEGRDRITQFLLDNGIKTYDGLVQQNNYFFDLIFQWVLPLLIFFLIWRFLMKGMEKKMGGGGGFMSFGKNAAKIYAENETGITFKDVAGQEEAKESLVEIVDFLNNPERYTEIGAKLPKGALLVGPPGTGKTLLAKAVAGEAGKPFFSISGSEFVQMFVGMGASRVRDLFAQAQEKAPCIVFIDEIDAIGKSREGNMSSNDEREQTLNQLLTEMDGFDSSKGVVILGATNRPEVLDQALLRPGRFDRRIIVDRPDLSGRKAILEVHGKKVKMSADVDLDAMAKATSGTSGAELANIINEGALLAVKDGRKVVEQKDLMEAFEIVIAGKIKKDRLLSEHEKKSVAYHEIGHALVAYKLPNTDPVHKITIIPRTKGALGYTMQLPTEEKYLVTKQEMEDEIAVMFGGRAAEEVMFNQISTGASNDIERASETARRMVTMYGMSEKFDMMGLESTSTQYMNGRPVRKCSSHTEQVIDEETLAIVKTQHSRAIKILEENKDALIKSAEYLLEHETISGKQFEAILNEKEIEEVEEQPALNEKTESNEVDEAKTSVETLPKLEAQNNLEIENELIAEEELNKEYEIETDSDK